MYFKQHILNQSINSSATLQWTSVMATSYNGSYNKTTVKLNYVYFQGGNDWPVVTSLPSL